MQKLRQMVVALLQAISAWCGRVWFRITLSVTVGNRFDALEARASALELALASEIADRKALEQVLCDWSGTLEMILKKK